MIFTGPPPILIAILSPFIFLGTIIFIGIVLTPLGFFYWFGASVEVMAVQPGHRLHAFLLLFLFYSLNSLLIYLRIKSKLKRLTAVSAYAMWVLGIAGLLTWGSRYSTEFHSKYFGSASVERIDGPERVP